jgi:hypothetical protein
MASPRQGRLGRLLDAAGPGQYDEELGAWTKASRTLACGGLNPAVGAHPVLTSSALEKRRQRFQALKSRRSRP